MTACAVPYCRREPKRPDLGESFCAKHKKAWAKMEAGPDAYAAWLAAQADLELDVCSTPAALALEICDRLARMIEIPARILEPSAGDGVFVRAARETWPLADITAVEIQKKNYEALKAAGADKAIIDDLMELHAAGHGGWPYAPAGSPDLVVGNPPFAVAEEHIRFLLSHMKDGAYLAFLLRVGFYGAKERLPFWEEHPERFFAPITPRPGFKLNKDGKPGTDSQEYGLFVWQKGFTGVPQRLPHIVWENGKRKGGKRKTVEAPTPELEAPELE